MIGNHQDKETTWKSDYVFIGRAYASCFRVTNLYMLSPNLEESPFSIEFRVQPVSCSRRKPRVEESECLLVEVNPWFSLLSVLFELYLAIFISAMKRISNIKYIHLEASWNSIPGIYCLDPSNIIVCAIISVGRSGTTQSQRNAFTKSWHTN